MSHYRGYQTLSVRSPHRTLRLFEIIIQIDEHDFAAKVPLRHQARLYLHDDKRLLIRARNDYNTHRCVTHVWYLAQGIKYERSTNISFEVKNAQLIKVSLIQSAFNALNALKAFR